MAEIVNLNKARKALLRAADGARAAENRVRHGRTGSQRMADRLAAERASRSSAQARLEPGPDGNATEA